MLNKKKIEKVEKNLDEAKKIVKKMAKLSQDHMDMMEKITDDFIQAVIKLYLIK